MAMERIKDGKLLYHLTRLSNFDSILKHGLVPRGLVKAKNIQFFDIADQEIISKRSELGLDHYTPFHFHPYSSFDVAVKKRYVNEDFIYICILREYAKQNKYKILPRHPLNSEKCTLYEYDEGFAAIDWVTMQSYGTEDRYVKNVKMAECLTKKEIHAQSFQCICVKNERIKRIVEEKLRENGIVTKPPFIDIRRWFE